MNKSDVNLQSNPAPVLPDLPESAEMFAKVLNQAFHNTLETVEAFVSTDPARADNSPMLHLFVGAQFLMEIDFASVIMDSAEKYRNPEVIASCLEALARKVRTERLILRC